MSGPAHHPIFPSGPEEKRKDVVPGSGLKAPAGQLPDVLALVRVWIWPFHHGQEQFPRLRPSPAKGLAWREA